VEHKFWMVYCPGRGAPSHHHETQSEAVIEAERIVRKEHRPCYVLEAVKVVQFENPPIVSRDLEVKK